MWYAIRCSYDTWSADYKRTFPAHSHDAEAAFVVAAKNAAVAALRGSGQQKYAAVTANLISTTGLQVKLTNDPGTGFKQI